MAKISERHECYDFRKPQWDRCRDFIAGADALRRHDDSCMGNQHAYLERLSDKQLDSEYLAYVRRALYDNTIRRIRNSLLGLVFAKEPVVELPASIEYMEDDCDLMETPLIEFSESVMSEILSVGRCGVLVDRPPMVDGLVQLDAEGAGYRPYFAMYKAETIINWKMARVGNHWRLVRVVLLEDDGRYRELTLDKNGYGVTIYECDEKKNEASPIYYPQLDGQPMEDIPFYFFGPQSGTVTPDDPPLIDVVETAMSWYKTSADLEHARFTCSLPTPYFFGFSEDDMGTIALGGLNGIINSNPDAKVGFLEYSGKGVEPLEKALETKYAMMARHGVDMLAEHRDSEATETVRIRAGVQTATLADMVQCFNRIMSQALTLVARWAGSTEEAEIECNTDYSIIGINPQEIATLMQGVIQKTVAIGDFIRRLRKVGLIEADRTDEDVMADLQGAVERDTGTL